MPKYNVVIEDVVEKTYIIEARNEQQAYAIYGGLVDKGVANKLASEEIISSKVLYVSEHVDIFKDWYG